MRVHPPTYLKSAKWGERRGEQKSMVYINSTLKGKEEKGKRWGGVAERRENFPFVEHCVVLSCQGIWLSAPAFPGAVPSFCSLDPLFQVANLLLERDDLPIKAARQPPDFSVQMWSLQKVGTKCFWGGSRIWNTKLFLDGIVLPFMLSERRDRLLLLRWRAIFLT